LKASSLIILGYNFIQTFCFPMASSIIQRRDQNQQMTPDNQSEVDGILIGDGDAVSGNSNTNLLMKLQMWSHLASHVLAFIAIGIVGWWISLLGGLAAQVEGNSKTVFNYHPLFMIIAFCFMTVASLSFQHYSLLSRPVRKLVHALSWSVATLCGLIAVIAVFQSHNDAKSGYIANLYSLHSWVGIFVISFYLIQWIIGLYAFGFGNPSWKSLAVMIHKYVGPILYQAVALNICLGIQEKEGFVGCSYKVEEADVFPIQHLWDIPLACRVSHGLGFIVLIMTILTTFAIQDFSSLSAVGSSDRAFL